MRVLIDTNIFIFYATDQQMLSRDVFTLITDYDNLIYISNESLRELVVHYNNKSLLRKFWSSKDQMLRDITEKYGFLILPLTPYVMYTYGNMNIYHNDPSDTTSGVPFPKCLFFSLTGLQCPGCGSQRALHSLLHLDLVAALRYNAYMVFLYHLFRKDRLWYVFPIHHSFLLPSD